MSMDDSLAWETDWENHCIVCGKSVLDGEGYCHMRVEGEGRDLLPIVLREF